MFNNFYYKWRRAFHYIIYSRLQSLYIRQNQVNFLVYGQHSKYKKNGSVGLQNINDIIWFLGSVFF